MFFVKTLVTLRRSTKEGRKVVITTKGRRGSCECCDGSLERDRLPWQVPEKKREVFFLLLPSTLFYGTSHISYVVYNDESVNAALFRSPAVLSLSLSGARRHNNIVGVIIRSLEKDLTNHVTSLFQLVCGKCQQASF